MHHPSFHKLRREVFKYYIYTTASTCAPRAGIDEPNQSPSETTVRAQPTNLGVTEFDGAQTAAAVGAGAGAGAGGGELPQYSEPGGVSMFKLDGEGQSERRTLATDSATPSGDSREAAATDSDVCSEHVSQDLSETLPRTHV